MTYATYAEAKEHQGVRGPIHWFGGKGLLVSKLVRLLPESWDTYVEPFVGGGALFFRLPRAGVEVINDADGALVGVYRALQDPEAFRKFSELARFTPYSRRLWAWCGAHWAEQVGLAERGWAWWVFVRQSFGAMVGRGWGTVVTSGSWGRGARSAGETWLPVVQRLPKVHERLQGVVIENGDGVEVARRWATHAGVLLYCDPPYVPETRRAGGYTHEMSIEDHERLLEVLLESPARIMVSGYDNDLYRCLDEAGWNRVEVPAVCHAAGYPRVRKVRGKGSGRRHSPRLEVIWRNYRRVGEEAQACLLGVGDGDDV